MFEVLLGVIVFLLISIGISHLWSHSDIFSYFRNLIALNFHPFFAKLFLCPECVSFWIGILVSFCFNPIAGVIIYKVHYLSHIFCGVITYLFTSPLYKKSVLE